MRKKKSMKKELSAWLMVICLVLQMFSGFNLNAEAAGEKLMVYGLECESTVNPLGLDEPAPRLSWKLESSQRGVLQTSYQIMAATSKEKLEAGNYDAWDSGIIESDQSVEIQYKGSPLEPGVRYYWKVLVTDNKGNTSVSTEEAYWETGLMGTAWDAKWIELAQGDELAPPKYTIEMDFRIIKDDAGIIFAGKDNANFLMWQINTFEKKFKGITSFRPHQWVRGSASCLEEFTIEDVIPVDQQKEQHHIKIDVDGKQITTFINGIQIDQRTNEYAAYGKLGFRQAYAPGDCDEQAAYDNIVVKDGDGTILFADNFDKGINTSFSIGSVENNELVVNNALGLQNDVKSSAPMYRKDFEVKKQVKKATIYASALGIYELELNGAKVGNDLFNPGWTNYELNQDDRNYVMYQAFDVTGMLNTGKNVLGAVTGHGWYSGKLFVGGKERYGKDSKFLCQLEIQYEDGEKVKIPTDATWMATGDGPIVEDDFQMGETYDAAKEMEGWSSTNFTVQGNWNPAKESGYDGAVTAHVGPAVKVIKEIKPVSVTEQTEGTYILDLGQNISGFARMKVTGEAGTVVKLRFGEMLQNDGSLYTANLRSAAATDYYTLKGDPNGETWQPRFTFHGFRYIEVSGYPGVPAAEDITGIAISSLQNSTGSFTTSNEDVNQLQSNITWGQLDNFISVPTDCPQRDERLGYTGDSQVFVRTAAMNQDVQTFFKKFMMDVTSNQRADGSIADWTPNYVTPGDGLSGSFGASGWGDGVIIIPWTMYTTYGDTSIIRQSYEGMKGWIRYYQGLETPKHLVEGAGNNYGDWLSVGANTPIDVICTGYYAYSCDLLSKMAEAIGETEDAAYYRNLFEAIKTGFNEAFVDQEGHVKGKTQTSYLIALKFNLLKDEAARKKAAAYLVEDIKNKNWHLSTGFMGVAYLCPMLTEMGYEEAAYRLLLQDSYPSWLYSVRSGATTIWERWNSYDYETGQFGDVGMNSFNHYSLGSVGEWFYNYVAGIKYDEKNPGYKHFKVEPYPGGSLSFANGLYESVYGTIESNWSYGEDNRFFMNVTVPANTTATIYVPAENKEQVMESGISAEQNPDLTFVKMENGRAVFEVGSGQYEFTTIQKRQYLLNVVNEDLSQTSLVSINGGEPQRLPVLETVYEGDTVTLSAKPENDVDYKFKRWLWDDMEEKTNEITLKIGGDTKLAIENSRVQRENLAIGKTADASTSISNADWGIKNINDGQLLSVKGSLGFTTNGSNSADVDHWLEIDLGEDMDFNRIHLYPRSDVFTTDGKTPSFPKDFNVQICKDGESNYTTAAEFTDYQAPFGKPAVLEWEQPISARKVRINVTKVGEPPAGEINYFQLAELGIYNEKEEVLMDLLIQEMEKAAGYEGHEADYTAASWKIFYDALQKAKEYIEMEQVSQEEIDAAAESLGLAISGLITAGDNEAPSKPENVKVTDIKETSVTITWGASRDNVGVEKYLIKNGAAIVSEAANELKAVIKGLSPNTAYTFTVTACDKAGNQSQGAGVSFKTLAEIQNTSVTSVKLNYSKLTIYGKSEKQLKAEVAPSNAANKKVTWKSSNKAVVSVDTKGKVTAKKPGNAAITVTTEDGKKTAVCSITVKSVKAAGISLNAKKKTLYKGKTVQLKYKLRPSNTTDQVQFISSDKKVAVVSSQGIVTAKKAGTTTITAKTTSKKKITCVIRVKEVKASSVKLNVKKKTLKPGKVLNLKAVIKPKNSTDTVKWESSDKKTAKVSSKGVVTALKKGKTTITVKTSSGKKASCVIVVK